MAVEVKICGLTRPSDAALAVRLGASRLGVIFAGGPRLITPARAREIVSAAGEVPVIGVFGSQSALEIAQLAAEAGLAGVQLHRTSTLAETVALRMAGFEVWRLVALSANSELGGALIDAASSADMVLLEPGHPQGGGGRGIPLPLALAREARQQLVGNRVALAGGLTPESVADAIEVVSPNAVDVSSGVESATGVKDPDRLERFMERVRDASPAP